MHYYRRYIVAATFAILYAFIWHTVFLRQALGASFHAGYFRGYAASAPSYSPLDVLQNQFPTSYFRDNLRNDTYYVTAWANAGMTNEFISYVHLIYLGFLSGRVPIVPPFVPDEHIPWSAGAISFGSVFNLDPLRRYLRRPVLEWSEVKGLPALTNAISEDLVALYHNPNIEALGCWSTRDRKTPAPCNAQNTEHLLGLDVSYTRVPDFTRMHLDNEEDPNVKFHWLSATITPNHSYKPTDSYPLFRASSSGSTLPPDEHLSCYDFLYYATSGIDELEWRYSWSPAWRHVGTHLRFSDHLLDLAKGYVTDALGIPRRGELPPLITVHIRHGDFVRQCWDGKPCLIATERFAQAVAEVQSRLSKERGLEVSNVLVSSDEENPEFWKDIRARGWMYINHTTAMTLERFGHWYPPLIDTVSLSFGVGFVGTETSTFSTLSAWRVKDWNDGIIELVTRQD